MMLQLYESEDNYVIEQSCTIIYNYSIPDLTWIITYNTYNKNPLILSPTGDFSFA